MLLYYEWNIDYFELEFKLILINVNVCFSLNEYIIFYLKKVVEEKIVVFLIKNKIVLLYVYLVDVDELNEIVVIFFYYIDINFMDLVFKNMMLGFVWIVGKIKGEGIVVLVYLVVDLNYFKG